MPLRRMARQVRDVLEVPRDLLLRRYPPFVTGGALPRGHVPVFVFHSLEPESFERKLRHLADNGYSTLGADAYFQVLLGARTAPERAVVLTFDDGRGTLWGVGRPLLRRYGMKGIVFLVPGRTPSRAGAALPPDWDDVGAGRAQAAEVLERDGRADGFLSWEEIEALALQGVYDFESHTLTHARVHVGSRIAGFVTPASQRGYAAMDVPWIAVDGADRTADAVPLGTPFFASQPRTSDAVRFLEDPGVRDACVAHVAAEGGASFFARPGWERALRALVPTVHGRAETPEEREQALRREMAEARRLIAASTGRESVHLCYPWHAAGREARRLAREAGYRSAFCGKVPGVPITLPGGDPLAIARIGEDYVELLPGRGRLRLTDVLRRKSLRRLRGRA